MTARVTLVTRTLALLKSGDELTAAEMSDRLNCSRSVASKTLNRISADYGNVRRRDVDWAEEIGRGRPETSFFWLPRI